MKSKKWILFLILFAVVGFAGTASAKLTVIGMATYNGQDYKLIYDKDQGLIWLDYTNSSLRWPLQMAWAAGLNAPGVVTGKFNTDVSVSWQGDWRLPKMEDGPRKFSYDGSTTAGFNNTTSELGHMFYMSLGNLGYYDTEGNARPGWGKPASEQAWGLKHTGPFDNLQSARYWTCTEYAANPLHAWAFNMVWGSQINSGFEAAYRFSGLAVRPASIDGR